MAKRSPPTTIERTALVDALAPTVFALKRLAGYRLEVPVRRRLKELGERKEFLNQKEHDELKALVAFSERRTIEKLEAAVALKRLQEAVPGLETR